jgi:galactokinase
MLVESNVPIGSGLSSSAALEVAVATALEAVLGITIDKRAKALLCQQAEHRFVGVPCGIMDQFISVFAEPNSLMLLDCRDQTFRLVPFDDRDVSILIVNSNVKHDLASSQYSIRRQECHSAALALGATSLRDLSESELKSRRNRLTDVEYRRAKHVISEIDRTGQCVKAIEARDWSAAGRLLYLSHESLRDDFDVSCRELDILVELAGRIGLKGGVYGSRLTGGGFGGCTVSLIARDCIEPVIRSLLADYRTATGRAANAFVTRPSSGARLVLGGI